MRLVLLGTHRSAPLYGRWPSDALLQWEGRGLGSLVRTAARLRSLDAEEALILAPSFRSALVARLARIPRRIGYDSDHRGSLLSERLRAPGRDTHLAGQYLALAVRFGADPDAPMDASIRVGSDEIARAEHRLRTLGFDGASTVALCPGATYGETKRWPVEHWVNLARRLAAEGDSLLVLGGAEERPIAARILDDVGVAARSLAGDLSLRDSLAILGRLAGAVSNDSGAMHLAAAAGCPVLGLFGSTNPTWTGPLGARSRAITLRLHCSPCYAKSCPTQIECLRDLDPARVADAFSSIRRRKEAGA
jgi:heptosyltransferase-2